MKRSARKWRAGKRRLSSLEKEPIIINKAFFVKYTFFLDVIFSHAFFLHVFLQQHPLKLYLKGVQIYKFINNSRPYNRYIYWPYTNTHTRKCNVYYCTLQLLYSKAWQMEGHPIHEPCSHNCRKSTKYLSHHFTLTELFNFYILFLNYLQKMYGCNNSSFLNSLC